MPRVVPPIEGRTAHPALPPSLVETVAGFTAGIVSTLAVHPFDVVKTRLQGRNFRGFEGLAREKYWRELVLTTFVFST